MPEENTPRWLQVFRDDGTGLFIIGVLSILRGVSYLSIVVNADRSPAHFLEGLLSAPVWSWVWLVIGVACLVAVVWRKAMPVAVGAAVGIYTAWALSFLGAWVFEDSQRGWLSALGYIGTGGLFLWAISRGKRGEVDLHFHDDSVRNP